MIKAYIDYMKKPLNDEWYTPSYAIYPIIKYLDKNKIIWCPFDTASSEYVKILKDNGFKVVYSHKFDGDNKDFFNFEPKEWDILVSNPPFSIKDDILKRCYQLGKPFALLLPLATLQSKTRGALFNQYGIQVLAFDKRIGFNHTNGVSFATAYLCWNLLPQPLIYKILRKDINYD